MVKLRTMGTTRYKADHIERPSGQNADLKCQPDEAAEEVGQRGRGRAEEDEEKERGGMMRKRTKIPNGLRTDAVRDGFRQKSIRDYAKSHFNRFCTVSFRV